MRMQRLSFMAVLLAGSLLPLAAHAQRGMSGRVSMSAPSRSGPAFAPRSIQSSSFGVRSGFGPRFVGTPTRGFAGPRVFVPNRAFVPRSGVRFSAGFGIGFRHFRDFDDFRFRRPFFFGGGCFNRFNPFCNQFFFGSTLGFGGSFGYAPYYPSYPVDYAYQPQPQQVIVEREDNNRDLSLEVERLSDEVQLLREEDLRSRSQSYNVAPQPQGSMSAQPPPAYTVLVFRDGRRLSVQNYAVAGSSLWIINEQAAKKVPLSDLDLAATEQANSVNGVEFKLPSAPR